MTFAPGVAVVTIATSELKQDGDDWLGAYIRFRLAGQSYTGKTNIWIITPKDSVGELGRVFWYAQWRKYAFRADVSAIFEPDCLRDIAKFLSDRTADQRKRRSHANPH